MSVSIVLNHTPLNNIRQENYSSSFESPISIDFLKKIFQKKVNGKLPGIAKVFNQLLFRQNNKWSMTISQQAIAKPARLSRLYTGEMLRQLEEYGLVCIDRNNRSNSTYSAHPMFSNPEVRQALSKRIPELNDKYVSKRKYYGDVMCASINAQNWAYKSDISEAYNNQKSITILKDISYEETEPFICDDGAIISDYTPYDFDSEPGQVLETSLEKETDQQFITKKDTVAMQELYSTTLVPAACQLKSIKVTLWGQIRLSCFPDEALQYADQRLLATNKPLEDRFRYFRAICESWCKENSQEVDWRYMLEMGKQYKMPNDGPFVDPDFLPVVVKKPAASSARYKTGGREKETDQRLARENEEILKREGVAGCLRQQQRHADEWEHVRLNDPVKFARWEANATAFRRQMGLNEDGRFIPGHSPHKAIEILVGSVTSPSEKCAREFEQPVFDEETIEDYRSETIVDYSLDPFGDRS